MLLLESLETALQRADEQLLFNAGTRRIRDLGRNRAASNQEGYRAKEQISKCDSPHLRILLNNQFSISWTRIRRAKFTPGCHVLLKLLTVSLRIARRYVLFSIFDRR